MQRTRDPVAQGGGAVLEVASLQYNDTLALDPSTKWRFNVALAVLVSVLLLVLILFITIKGSLSVSQKIISVFAIVLCILAAVVARQFLYRATLQGNFYEANGGQRRAIRLIDELSRDDRRVKRVDTPDRDASLIDATRALQSSTAARKVGVVHTVVFPCQEMNEGLSNTRRLSTTSARTIRTATHVGEAGRALGIDSEVFRSSYSLREEGHSAIKGVQRVVRDLERAAKGGNALCLLSLDTADEYPFLRRGGDRETSRCETPTLVDIVSKCRCSPPAKDPAGVDDHMRTIEATRRELQRTLRTRAFNMLRLIDILFVTSTDEGRRRTAVETAILLDNREDDLLFQFLIDFLKTNNLHPLSGGVNIFDTSDSPGGTTLKPEVGQRVKLSELVLNGYPSEFDNVIAHCGDVVLIDHLKLLTEACQVTASRDVNRRGNDGVREVIEVFEVFNEGVPERRTHASQIIESRIHVDPVPLLKMGRTAFLAFLEVAWNPEPVHLPLTSFVKDESVRTSYERFIDALQQGTNPTEFPLVNSLLEVLRQSPGGSAYNLLLLHADKFVLNLSQRPTQGEVSPYHHSYRSVDYYHNNANVDSDELMLDLQCMVAILRHPFVVLGDPTTGTGHSNHPFLRRLTSGDETEKEEALEALLHLPAGRGMVGSWKDVQRNNPSNVMQNLGTVGDVEAFLSRSFWNSSVHGSGSAASPEQQLCELICQQVLLLTPNHVIVEETWGQLLHAKTAYEPGLAAASTHGPFSTDATTPRSMSGSTPPLDPPSSVLPSPLGHSLHPPRSPPVPISRGDPAAAPVLPTTASSSPPTAALPPSKSMATAASPTAALVPPTAAPPPTPPPTPPPQPNPAALSPSGPMATRTAASSSPPHTGSQRNRLTHVHGRAHGPSHRPGSPVVAEFLYHDSNGADQSQSPPSTSDVPPSSHGSVQFHSSTGRTARVPGSELSAPIGGLRSIKATRSLGR